MKRITRSRYILASTVIVLMLLSFLSGVFVAKNILKVVDTVPATALDVDVSKDNNNSENNISSDDEAGETSVGQDSDKNGRPQVEAGDKEGVWKKETHISLFKASYDNEKGEVTVYSSNGDKVVAPGTSNEYEFYINNKGDTGVRYVLECGSKLDFIVNGETRTVPIEAKFSTDSGKYLLGTENSFEDMTKLEGVTDKSSISSGFCRKYTVEWQWPFEGNDEFDTLMGNMAATGDEITVMARFEVTAIADENASGGSPQTGDVRNIGLWVTVFFCLFFTIVVLLFAYKKERENEDEAAAEACK